MPSPIAHGSLVFVVDAITARHEALRRAVGVDRVFMYGAAVVTLWAADIDFALRLLSNHPSLAHGGSTHSLAAGLFFALAFGSACRLRYGPSLPWMPALAIGIGCAWAHPLMDMATWQGGVMLLWPIEGERIATIPLFVGARHSQLMAWRLHLFTLISELAFVVPLWWLTRRFRGVM